MTEPEYLICINCETPCYTFDWADGRLIEAFCNVCGAEDVDEFMTQDEFDALEAG